MKYFFTAQVYLELQLNADALSCYEKLRVSHFACSTYVMSQLALAYHNIRGLSLASLPSVFCGSLCKRLLNKVYFRVTTCLENLEMSGILLKVREMSEKKSCQGIVA